jgi:ribosomal protein S1
VARPPLRTLAKSARRGGEHMTSESKSWDSFVERHQVGDTVAVTVTNALPFLGCLVEASDGVPGLLKGIRLRPGERVRARIDAIDTELRRISVVCARPCPHSGS